MLRFSAAQVVFSVSLLFMIITTSGCQESKNEPVDNNTEVSTEQVQQVPHDVVEMIAKKFADVRSDLVVTSVTDAEVEGMYKVEFSGKGSIYVVKDGNYFFTGDLIKIEDNNFVNVKELELKEPRKQAMDAVAAEDMIIFSPEQETKASIYVFTDVDCGYCRKLHNEVPRLNELGIEVKYLAFPRTGIDSKSYNKIVSAWCAEDQHKALSALKRGEEIAPLRCASNPVTAQYQLGQVLGVTGTPAIVLADGTLMPGYLPADQLAKKIGVL